MYRLLVCGGRDFSNNDLLAKTLKDFNMEYGIDVLIHGGAKGADISAGLWANANEIPSMIFPARWKTYGKKRAGYLRNREMLEKGMPDYVIAFPGGTGTANMIKQSKENNITVEEIEDE